MFGRSPKAPAPVAPPVEPEVRPGSKGRPTPKREAARAANRVPLVPDDRRGATKASREAARADRQRAYQGRQAGEEKYLLPRDRGPRRRFVRDVVDSRFNVGEFILPAALTIFVVSLFGTGSSAVTLGTTVALYVIVLVVIVDSFLLGLRVRRELEARWGPEAVERGIRLYAVARACQFRRARLPKPAVARGEDPR